MRVVFGGAPSAFVGGGRFRVGVVWWGYHCWFVLYRFAPCLVFLGAGFSVCFWWVWLRALFLVYSGKRRFEPFALSVSYVFECKFFI